MKKSFFPLPFVFVCFKEENMNTKFIRSSFLYQEHKSWVRWGSFFSEQWNVYSVIGHDSFLLVWRILRSDLIWRIRYFQEKLKISQSPLIQKVFWLISPEKYCFLMLKSSFLVLTASLRFTSRITTQAEDFAKERKIRQHKFYRCKLHEKEFPI